jgi:hypothetical protein
MPLAVCDYGSYVDEPLMMKAAQNKYYYATNHLYSVVAFTDSTGAVVERYKYGGIGSRTGPQGLRILRRGRWNLGESRTGWSDGPSKVVVDEPLEQVRKNS